MSCSRLLKNKSEGRRSGIVSILRDTAIPGFVFCALGLITMCGCQHRQPYRETRLMLGTYVEVISPSRQACEIAFKEIKKIEGLLSKYDPRSEISGLNASGSLRASPQTYYVLKRAKEFWINSAGAFDVTVGPLVDLWGFTDKHYRIPSEDQIKKTLELVGMDKVILDDSRASVEFTRPGMKIDLGAIAKGYAVDCAIDKMKQAGIKSCLINAGGQIYCLGDNFGRPWKVAIRAPGGGQAPGALLEVRDKAVATSGNYEQFFIKDNIRYSHILNPKTGYPVATDVACVTVVAADGLTADALSTSLFVLGRIKAGAMVASYPGAWFKMIENPS